MQRAIRTLWCLLVFAGIRKLLCNTIAEVRDRALQTLLKQGRQVWKDECYSGATK